MSNILIKDLETLEGDLVLGMDFIIVERVAGTQTKTYKLPLSALLSESGSTVSPRYLDTFTVKNGLRSWDVMPSITFSNPGLLNDQSSFMLTLSSSIGSYVMFKRAGDDLINNSSGLIPSSRQNLPIIIETRSDYNKSAIGEVLYGDITLDKNNGKIIFSNMLWWTVKGSTLTKNRTVFGPALTATIDAFVVAE